MGRGAIVLPTPSLLLNKRVSGRLNIKLELGARSGEGECGETPHTPLVFRAMRDERLFVSHGCRGGHRLHFLVNYRELERLLIVKIAIHKILP